MEKSNKKSLWIIILLVIIAAVIISLCLKKPSEPVFPNQTEEEETLDDSEMTPDSDMQTEPETILPPEPIDEDIMMPKVGILN